MAAVRRGACSRELRRDDRDAALLDETVETFLWHCKPAVQSDATSQATTENGTVLRVELGVYNLAVSTNGTFWTDDTFDQ